MHKRTTMYETIHSICTISVYIIVSLLSVAIISRAGIESDVPFEKKLQHITSGSGKYAPIYYGGDLGQVAAYSAYDSNSRGLDSLHRRYGIQWIVTLKTDADIGIAQEACAKLVKQSHNQFQCIWSNDMLDMLRMFEVKGTLPHILQLRTLLGTGCKAIERDLGSTAMRIPWHLDRLDQSKLPLDGKPYPQLFSPFLDDDERSTRSGAAPITGRNISVYVLDSGVEGENVCGL